LIIAVDPGASGGITSINKKKVVTAIAMPETDVEIFEHFNNLLTNYRQPDEPVFGYLEKVGGFIGYRKKYKKCLKCGGFIEVLEGDPGSYMFKFGDGYGFIRAQFVNRRITFHNPTPQEWLKGLCLSRPKGASKLSKTEWKNNLKKRASEFFPGLKPTLKTADALLILKYGMLREGK